MRLLPSPARVGGGLPPNLARVVHRQSGDIIERMLVRSPSQPPPSALLRHALRARSFCGCTFPRPPLHRTEHSTVWLRSALLCRLQFPPAIVARHNAANHDVRPTRAFRHRASPSETPHPPLRASQAADAARRGGASLKSLTLAEGIRAKSATHALCSETLKRAQARRAPQYSRAAVWHSVLVHSVLARPAVTHTYPGPHPGS